VKSDKAYLKSQCDLIMTAELAMNAVRTFFKSKSVDSGGRICNQVAGMPVDVRKPANTSFPRQFPA
jgi:hypothetical protein